MPENTSNRKVWLLPLGVFSFLLLFIVFTWGERHEEATQPVSAVAAGHPVELIQTEEKLNSLPKPKDPHSLPAAQAPKQQDLPQQKPIPKMDNKRFVELLEKTEKEFLTVEQASKRKAEDLHQPPPELFRVGKNFADIRAQLKKNPELVAPTTEAFFQWAQNEDYVESIRAVSLANAIYWSKKANPPVNLDLEKVSKRIRDITKDLPKPTDP